LNSKEFVSIIFDPLNDILFTHHDVVPLFLFQVLEETIHQCVVMLVEDTDLILGVFMVWDFKNALSIDHAFENDCAIILDLWIFTGVFLSLMRTFQVPHEWLLIPELKQLSSTVIL
jgi:hypothetical protein